MTLLDETKIALALSVAALLGSLTHETILLIEDARAAIRQETADAHALVLPTQKAEAAIAAASVTFAQVGAKERDAFAAQQAYFEDASTRTNVVLDQTALAARRINVELLPDLSRNLDGAFADWHRVSANLADTTASGSRALDAIPSVLDSLRADTDAARPAIERLDSTGAHVDAISANLDVETGILVAQTRKAVAPKNKFLAALNALVGGSITAAEFLYYVAGINH